MSYEFNMVDMGGIDIATVNGTVVEGLYNKLLEGMDACGNLILYNWKFAEIEIAPSACSVLIEDEAIIVNGTIRVSSDDVISLIWADPPPVPVSPLIVNANGIYTAEPPASGFNPVTVHVPNPRTVPIVIQENGTYFPPAGVFAFSSVTVKVSGLQEVPYDVEYEQGSVQGQQGSYASNKISSTTRIRPVDIVSVEDYTNQQVLVIFNKGYDIAFQWYNSSGMWVTSSSWYVSNFLTTISNPNLVILIRHDDNSAITADEFHHVGLRIILTSSL